MAGPIILPSGNPKWPPTWGDGSPECCCGGPTAGCCTGGTVPATRVLTISGFTDCDGLAWLNGSWVLPNSNPRYPLFPACTWERKVSNNGIVAALLITSSSSLVTSEHSHWVSFTFNLGLGQTVSIKYGLPGNAGCSHGHSSTHDRQCRANSQVTETIRLTS